MPVPPSIYNVLIRKAIDNVPETQVEGIKYTLVSVEEVDRTEVFGASFVKMRAQWLNENGEKASVEWVLVVC